MGMLLYSFGLLLALLITAPYWLLHMLFYGKYREGLAERLGQVPQHLVSAVGGRRTVWIHAVSVGELIAVSGVAQSLQQSHPELAIVVSTTTRTSQRLARARFGAERVFYFPLDFAWIVRRYLRVLQPVLLVLAETELWPRLLQKSRKAGAEIVLVNGRISDRSLPRYHALRRLWQPFLGSLARVLAQSEEDAQRFASIGVPASAITVSGNLKYDVRVPRDSALPSALRAAIPAGAKVVVAGSTLDKEEAMLLDAFTQELQALPELVMILAPRHPERFAAVAALLTQRGLPWVRRTLWAHTPAHIAPGSVVLLDSIGELAGVYALASVAFVGGSLVPAGGHNPLEPAQFGVPILTGAHTQNFRGIMSALLMEDAIAVTTPQDLHSALHRLLTSAEAAAMGQRAYSVFEQQAGAFERTLSALEQMLHGSGSHAVLEPAR
jgi:3-deoxy-D-manno-octulosonic-acid transferase